jgi:hypothetical protein
VPCTAPVRGKTDTKYPWDPDIQNDPCGVPDVWAGGLCKLHWQMANGLVAGPDPATVLLLHGETLADVLGHPVTAVGDAKVDSSQSVFGGSSLRFDGAGDYLSIPDSPDWAFGSGNFTIDFWVRFVAINDTFLLSQWVGPANQSWMIRFNGTSIFMGHCGDGTNAFYGVQSAWVPVVDTWYHVAVVRFAADSYKVYVNGAGLAQNPALSGIGSFFDANAPLLIGGLASGFWLNGWMDEIRISKGIARWTANFTPPSGPY